jgi:hypothetical protein
MSYVLTVYGIDIPGILLHYSKCVNEGNMPQSQGDENCNGLTAL